jgi:hypothetical protein
MIRTCFLFSALLCSVVLCTVMQCSAVVEMLVPCGRFLSRGEYVREREREREGGREGETSEEL